MRFELGDGDEWVADGLAPDLGVVGWGRDISLRVGSAVGWGRLCGGTHGMVMGKANEVGPLYIETETDDDGYLAVKMRSCYSSDIGQCRVHTVKAHD